MRNNALMVMVSLATLIAVPALAQSGGGSIDNPECLGTQCGTPKEEGGGGCGCGCGCSVWVAFTDDGKTLAYTDDADNDGKADDVDNCPMAGNRDQLDDDGDGVGNSCDNCMAGSNFSQLDSDGDGIGDACDEDIDGDTILNTADNCATVPNKLQTNSDLGAGGDLLGDVCDSDDDNDGVADVLDNCDTIANPNQETLQDARCSIDTDVDGILDSVDNCLDGKNATQLDTDGDGIGDVCDSDIDNDGVLNISTGGVVDNCPMQRNRGQLDDDGDGLGDSCDSHYCVVVDASNKEDCLDPKLPFKVSGGGQITLKKGEKFLLPLFANRNGAPIEYVWTVKKAPAGSAAAVINPKGAVTTSRHWLYQYPEGMAPSFTADIDGQYDIQLQADLKIPDRAYPNQGSSTASLMMTATPDGKPGSASCTAFPVDAGTASIALAMLAMLRRRKS